MPGKSLEAVKVGIIGVGYMGRNHARILSAMPGVELVGLFDIDLSKAREAASEFGTDVFSNEDDAGSRCDALVLASPTELHFEQAKNALESGLDVLVEKPVTGTVDRARELCRIASEKNRILQVGHVERFNPACFELHRMVTEPVFLSFERLSPYIPSWVGETGVILDLMIHDLDIALSLVGEEVVEVQALSVLTRSSTEDLAVAGLKFSGGTLAALTSSRISQAKVRRLSVTQGDSYITADLLRQTIAVHSIVSNDFFYDERMGYRQEAVTEIPYLSRHGEPLRLELESFLEAVRERTRPVVGCEDGLRALQLALRIMEEAESP